jgi:DNA-binding beta-propeller fold protein YncE
VASYDSNAVDVFARDPATGKIAERGCLSDVTYVEEPKDGCVHAAPLSSPTGLAVSPNGRRIFVTMDAGLAVLERDASTGGLRHAGCATYSDYDEDSTKKCIVARGLAGAANVALSPDGVNIYVAASASNAVAEFTPAVSITPGRTLNGHRLLAVSVACPLALAEPCAGVVTLTRRPGFANVAAPRPFAVAPGTSRVVFLRLTAALREAISHRRPLSAILAASDPRHCPSAVRERMQLGRRAHAPPGRRRT